MLRIYRQYELLCEQLGVIDFAELLLRVLELWRNNPEGFRPLSTALLAIF
jgi:DNA helicase-2/ATP-dependent DNA helicase PcrA